MPILIAMFYGVELKREDVKRDDACHVPRPERRAGAAAKVQFKRKMTVSSANGTDLLRPGSICGGWRGCNVRFPKRQFAR
jgi:hypothetical protein